MSVIPIVAPGEGVALYYSEYFTMKAFLLYTHHTPLSRYFKAWRRCPLRAVKLWHISVSEFFFCLSLFFSLSTMLNYFHQLENTQSNSWLNCASCQNWTWLLYISLLLWFQCYICNMILSSNTGVYSSWTPQCAVRWTGWNVFYWRHIMFEPIWESLTFPVDSRKESTYRSITDERAFGDSYVS